MMNMYRGLRKNSGLKWNHCSQDFLFLLAHLSAQEAQNFSLNQKLKPKTSAELSK